MRNADGALVMSRNTVAGVRRSRRARLRDLYTACRPARRGTGPRGRSRSKIAKRLYGDPKLHGVVFNANRDRIHGTNLLIPEQGLLIPNLAEYPGKGDAFEVTGH